MLWLFGQIWLWLLISFLLGAAVMWVLTQAAPRIRPRAAVAEPEPPRPPAEPSTPIEAERTRHFAPAAEPAHYDHHDDHHYDHRYEHYEYHDEEPERVYNDYPDVDPDEPYQPQDSGGYPLPDPEPRLSGELNWPSARDHPPPDRPRADQPARRPGRGG